MEYTIKGKTILLDPEFEYLLDNHDWRIDPYGYALTTITLTDGSKFPMRLHQMVLGHVPRSSGLVIDHENRKPWDNRLSNLRYVSRGQNWRNSARGDIFAN